MRDATAILDPVTRKVRVLAEKCSTCIFRPGNLMDLRDGALQEIIQSNLKAGALLTCHQTLPEMKFRYGLDPAACHGFWEGYGRRTTAGRLALAYLGILYIEPPTEIEGDDCEQAEGGPSEDGPGDEPEADQDGPSPA